MSSELFGKINLLVVTLDSCRWDTWARAATPNTDARTLARSAYTQATFTLPAHLAIYQGILPQTTDRLPLYNRYTKQLVRICHRPSAVPALIAFTASTTDIIRGFAGHNYFTLGIGAVRWFTHPWLTAPFHEFHYTGIYAQRQVEILLDRLSESIEPFMAVLNMGETHDPYQFGGQIKPPELSPSRRPHLNEPCFLRELWLNQVAACEYLDGILGDIFRFLEKLNRGTIVVVAGDHGECFGEDGQVGHGFHHEKVMNVPLAIFEINGEHLEV